MARDITLLQNSVACSQEEVLRAETCARAATICLQDRGPRSHTPPLAFLGTLSRKNPKNILVLLAGQTV